MGKTTEILDEEFEKEEQDVKHESAAETARRIFDEFENGEEERETETDDSSDPEPEPDSEELEELKEEPKKEAKKPDKAKKEKPKVDKELLPPERLNAEEREAFAAMTPEGKKIVHRAVKNLESRLERERQELSKHSQYSKAIWEAAAPFAEKWGKLGVTIPQAIAHFGALQQEMTSPDETVRYKAFARLAQQSKIDLQKLTSGQVGGSAEESALVKELRSEISALRNELSPLKSQYETSSRQQFDQGVNAIVSDYEAIRSEADDYGNPIFPKLYEPDFLRSVSPLVEERMRSVPGLQRQDAIRQVYAAITGNPLRSNQARPSANMNSAASRAASSVRGRSAPARTSTHSEVPPEALKDARSTLEYFLGRSGR